MRTLVVAMERLWGPHFELGEPTASERDWIFAALSRPEIYVPLNLGAPPTRADFDANRLVLGYERELEDDVRYLVARGREDGRARVFTIDFAFGDNAGVREGDIAVPEEDARGLVTLREVMVLHGAWLFHHGLARRVRIVAFDKPGGGPRTWPLKLAGGRYVGRAHAKHPVTAEPLVKHIYETTWARFTAEGTYAARLLARVVLPDAFGTPSFFARHPPGPAGP